MAAAKQATPKKPTPKVEPAPQAEPKGYFFDGAISRLMMEEGRLPRIEDKRKPWTYRGFLIPSVIACENHPAIPNRWGYYLNALQDGKLPDTAIPPIEFSTMPDPGAMKEFLKWVDILERTVGGWSSFLKLIDWLAWALGVGDDPKLPDKVNEQLYREVNLGPLMLHPYDYLGNVMSEHKGSGRWNPNAFYPTPHNLVEMMVRMLFMDGEDYRCKSVCDPCVGTGRMLLHASNHSMALYGQDVDPVVVACTKINGALYAPWMTWPLPGKILGLKYTPPPPPAPLEIEADYVPEPTVQPTIELKKKPRKRIDDRQGTLF